MERWEEAEEEEEGEGSFQKEGKWGGGGRKSERGEEGEGFVRTRNASTTPAPVPCWTPDTPDTCNRWAFTLSLSLASQNMEPDLKFSTVSFHWYNNDLFWFIFYLCEMLTFEKWNLILISDVYSANLKWGSKVTFQNFNLSWKFKSKHFKIMITDFHFCMILKRVSTCYRYYWFVYISHWF